MQDHFTIKKLLPLLLIGGFLFCNFSFLKEDNSGKVHWAEKFDLSWQHFKGVPDTASHFASVIDAGISYREKPRKSFTSFSVRAFFHPTSSWAKEKGKSEELLKHEAGHFDLAEISARRLRKKISETEFLKKNYLETFKNLWAEAIADFKQKSKAYDEETNHSLEQKKQKKWVRQIEKELRATEEFKDTIVRVVFVREK